MEKIKPAGEERVVYSGKIFEIVKQPIKVGNKIIEFETARRAPGTRLIVVKENEVLLRREFRTELDDYDYRLPGGKVFNKLEEFQRALKKKSSILKHAEEAAKKECVEETGLIPLNIVHYHTAKAGATIEWDLFYFVIDSFEENPDGQELEEGEVIHPEWRTVQEAKEMCINGEVKEDRTVGILLRFLENRIQP